MKRAIKYKDALELGFERFEMNDSVFFDYNGYGDFYMFLQFGKYEFAWYPEKDYTILRKINKNKDIVSQLYIYSLSELKCLVSFFKCQEKPIELNKPTDYYNEMLAC